MFKLEQEIKLWLRQFRKHRAFHHGSIREMEQHLRDHIDDLIGEGHSEQEAFNMAVKEFGEIPGMAREEFRNLHAKTTIKSLVHAALVRNFYFTSLRHLFKHRNYFIINLSGLTIGIAGFIFISLYLLNELSYDRFHTNYERIFRVHNSSVTSTGIKVDVAVTHAPLARILIADYPEVSKATRIRRNGSSMLVGTGDEYVSEEGILYADSNFLDVFDFKMTKGNPKKALVNPRSLVLSESYAKKYFGDSDPLGQQLTLEDDTLLYAVTGIVEDVPANSHIQFDILASMNSNTAWNGNDWIGWELYTYIELAPGSPAQALEAKMPAIMRDYVGPEIEKYTGRTFAEYLRAGNSPKYYLLPLKDIHLHSISTKELEPVGNLSYIYIYALIGIVILFIAVFNFVNLATVQSTTRAKEVGVRKVIGSSRTELIYQFILESVLLALFATALAGVVVSILLPSFILLVGKDLAFTLTSGSAGLISLVVLAILVGVLAGAFPAFALASYQPVDVLKGSFHKQPKSGGLRGILVVIQFAASMVIIIVTLVVYNQLEYMLSRNLGFDRDQILVIRRSELLKGALEPFENDLLLNPGIRAVALSKTIPGKDHAVRSYRPHENNPQENYLFSFNHVSYNFNEILGLELISGRFFSKDFGQNATSVVINEAAAKALEVENPIGLTLTSPWHRGQIMEIVGVVKDFNFESLHKSIEPLAMEMVQGNTSGYIMVKIGKGQDIHQTMEYIKASWAKHSHDKLFESFFFDEDYESLYKSEFSTGQVFVVFAALSIFIACLGLIGLFAFMISAREKELGIRKVLGAGVFNLVNLLSGQLVKLIAVATFIAWPLSYFVTQYWLQNFNYRLPINPAFFIVSTVILAAICTLAISSQVVNAVRSNPVNSLRSE